MRVAVTGATGFVGRSVCRRLQQAGHQTTAVVRRLPRHGLNGVADTVEIADTSSVEAWRTALKSAQADAIVHLIGHTHACARADRSEATFDQVNVGITQALLEAAAESGIERFIYMSSVKALAEASQNNRPLLDTDIPRPQTAYGRSKLRAEAAVAEMAQTTGATAISLRPPLVYGPGSGGNFARLIRLVRAGAPLPFKGVRNRRSMIFVENLADAVAATLAAPMTSGSYLVSDGETVSTPDLIRALCAASGSPSRLFWVPSPVLSALAKLPVLGPSISRLTGSLDIDATRFSKVAGWLPPIPFEQAIAESVSSELPTSVL